MTRSYDRSTLRELISILNGLDRLYADTGLEFKYVLMPDHMSGWEIPELHGAGLSQSLGGVKDYTNPDHIYKVGMEMAHKCIKDLDKKVGDLNKLVALRDRLAQTP